MSDHDYMLIALDEAKAAKDKDEVPVGAILVRNGEIIARAHNLTESMNDSSAHAEMLCLKEGMKKLRSKYLSDCTLYVSLEPCAMCAGAMINARLGRLFFGAFDERCGCCGSALDLVTEAFYHSIPTVGGIAEEECALILKQYFSSKR